MDSLLKIEDKTKPDETLEELQGELVRLQRQFRLLEEDRRAYREETKYILKKQRNTINNLNAEHEDLEKDYKLARSVKNQNFDRENVEKLQALLKEEENMKAELKAQKKKNSKVNKKIKKVRATMESFHKKMGGCKASERRCKAIIKLNHVMENRLDEGNVKFNNALAENAELRKEIDHINQQRRKFTELQQKLLKVLMKGKGEKEHLIEQSTLLFNSRDEAEHRMHSLRERSERDMNHFNSELKDLLRVIDHDKKLQAFMETKMEERSGIYEAAVNGRKEKKLLNYVKSLEVELEHYESIFNDLVEVSGTSDMDEMVTKFIRVEDNNFAQFKFVKEQSQDIQLMETGMESLKDQISKMQKENVILETNHKRIKHNLEETERKLSQTKAQFSEQIKKDENALEDICSKIESILGSVKCDRSVMNDLLAGSKITSETLSPYLGLIEQRATELLQARSLTFLRKDGLNEVSSEDEPAPMSFATVGKIARYLMRMPSVSEDLPEVGPPTEQDNMRPISQRETREIIKCGRMELASRQSAARVPADKNKQ